MEPSSNYARSRNQDNFESFAEFKIRHQLAAYQDKTDPLTPAEDSKSPRKLTSKDVQLLVERVLGTPNTKIVSYEIKPYSSEKLGFLGAHNHLQVSVIKLNSPRRKELENLDFFVKSLPYEVDTQVSYIRERRVFLKEALFFEKLLPLLKEGYQGEEFCPNSYLVEDGFLVLQDLRKLGFSPRSGLFSEESLKSALSCLARFHAASLLTEHRLQKGLLEICPEAFQEASFSNSGKLFQCFITGVELAVVIAENLGLDASRIPQVCEKVFHSVLPSSCKRNVICHGDLWSSNLLFDETSPPRCLLVDFQLIRYCPPAQDVAYLLHLTTSRDFRKTRGTMMLRYYYSVLEEAIRAHNTSMEVPTWSEIATSMEEQRLIATVSAVQFLPNVLMDAELCHEVFDDPENYETFVFRDRWPVVFENMKRDSEYKRRVEEAVKELHELSMRIEHLPIPT
ncbi:uncharacterized protein LOC105703807 [Orussus abietinus]|uniref:uncharacterized protein LOC105703807 n=1 Tax=Orussus abietinus TaxID=222816 RepID=UPI0006262E30|nr:uncharacterized protein LOC105703807 [Orussus abietinus]